MNEATRAANYNATISFFRTADGSPLSACHVFTSNTVGSARLPSEELLKKLERCSVATAYSQPRLDQPGSVGRMLAADSAFAHADLMLAVISHIASPSLAHLVARYLVLDDRPSQSRYMVMEYLRTSDPILQKVERFITRNLERQIPLAELAHVAAVSPRTLARRAHAGLGMTPNKLVQRMRVSHATHLLESSQVSLEEVAARVGYADGAAFRRVFRRYAGEPPRGRRNQIAEEREWG